VRTAGTLGPLSAYISVLRNGRTLSILLWTSKYVVMRVTIVDVVTGRSFKVEVCPETTPDEIAAFFIEEGYIQPVPSGYYWVLVYQGRRLDPVTPIAKQRVPDGAKLEFVPIPVCE